MKDLPPKLRQVVHDAMEHGARSFTLAPGSPTVRIHLEPEREHVSHLRVFLAHATLDRDWAARVADEFARIGFQPTYLPVGGVDLGSSQHQITDSLVARVTEADYLCLLFSQSSASRYWIQLEFAVAARLIGRVLMLRDSSVSTAREFSTPQFAFRALLTTKYQLLDYAEDPTSMLKAARILINHPDEGVTNGDFRPLSIRERNLKVESLRRKRMRLFLDEVPEYSERHVVDVLPFRWDELEINDGDISKVFNWFVRKHGRLNMAVQVSRGALEASVVTLPAEQAVLLDGWPSDLCALVLWKSDWDPARDERVLNARM